MPWVRQRTAPLGGQPLTFAAQLFALAGKGTPLFFGGRGHANHTHGPQIAAQEAIQIQDQFAGIGFVGHHPFMLGIKLLRMHDERRDAQRGELAVEVKSTRPGFVNHEHLVGQSELFLHEGQKTVRGEPLRRLGRLAITHPDHPEMIGVPVHAQFELLDSLLRFRIERRIRFHRHV
jgi:hypothetical protein